MNLNFILLRYPKLLKTYGTSEFDTDVRSNLLRIARYRFNILPKIASTKEKFTKSGQFNKARLRNDPERTFVLLWSLKQANNFRTTITTASKTVLGDIRQWTNKLTQQRFFSCSATNGNFHYFDLLIAITMSQWAPSKKINWLKYDTAPWFKNNYNKYSELSSFANRPFQFGFSVCSRITDHVIFSCLKLFFQIQATIWKFESKPWSKMGQQAG